ncbi:hypothetical protein MTO96_007139 [Rhipicephalus appendiculatus]
MKLDVPNADSFDDETEDSLDASSGSDYSWNGSDIDEASTDSASEFSDEDPEAPLVAEFPLSPDTSYDSVEMDYEHAVSSDGLLDGAIEDELVGEYSLPSGAASCGSENVR